jgi:hypothetical protein
MSETDTPRTDAAIRDTWQAGNPQKVEAEFARALERELAAMTASAQWYKDEWEKMRKAYAHECDPKLFDRLVAMTAERDALVQTSGTLCPHCGWRGLRGDPEQCAFCQNAKLSADLFNMTAERDAFERLCIKQADRAELAERQVDVLCKRIDGVIFGSTICSNCPARDRCSMTGCRHETAAWSRAEAAKGGNG